MPARRHRFRGNSAAAGGGAQLQRDREDSFTDVASTARSHPAFERRNEETSWCSGRAGGYGASERPIVTTLDGAENRYRIPPSKRRPRPAELLRQVPGSAVVQYLVFNEFEQRFSTSRSVECLQYLPLSQIDTTQPNRSIFSAGVSGTLAGQSRLQPIGDGLVGVAIEGYGTITFETDGMQYVAVGAGDSVYAFALMSR